MIDLSTASFVGQPLDDHSLLATLPNDYVNFLRTTNGCILFDGGLHIRGCCAKPDFGLGSGQSVPILLRRSPRGHLALPIFCSDPGTPCARFPFSCCRSRNGKALSTCSATSLSRFGAPPHSTSGERSRGLPPRRTECGFPSRHGGKLENSDRHEAGCVGVECSARDVKLGNGIQDIVGFSPPVGAKFRSEG